MHRPYLDIDDRVDALLVAERRLASGLQQEFSRKFIIGWLHHELAVEGVVTTDADIVRALANREGTDYCDGVMLDTIRAYRAAMTLIRDAACRRTPIDRAFVEKLHATLSRTPGPAPLRTDDGATEQYKHDVLDPEHIEEELAALLSDVEQRAHTRHPLQLAAQVHYRFVRIWPFQTHSGIVARMLANRILLGHGYPPVIFPSYDRQRYYHSLHYDVTRLHDLMIECFHAQLGMRERLARRSASCRELRAS
jgi:Fic family protein